MKTVTGLKHSEHFDKDHSKKKERNHHLFHTSLLQFTSETTLNPSFPSAPGISFCCYFQLLLSLGIAMNLLLLIKHRSVWLVFFASSRFASV